MSFTHAIKWSFLSELAAKAIQPVVFIFLARLLTPEDFGVMTAAMMVIAFSQIFWEAGMGKALVQRQTDIHEAANAAFWINIALGIIIAGLLYQFAQPIAYTFFQDERVTNVLRVMTLQVLLGAFSSVQTALLQKEMGFKKLFWVRFATVSLPGLASIPLAWNGWGYWALVAGTLIGQFAQVIMLWHMSHWRPGLTKDLVVTKEMTRFGAWVGTTGMLSWFYAWADSLVVGHYLGSHDLGLFRTGAQFPAMIFGMLFGPITPVLYSQLARMGNSREKLRQTAEMIIGALTIAAIPIAAMLFIFSEHIEVVIFGPKWTGIGVVIGAMALMHGFSWIVGMNGEFYRALGKPSYETMVTAGLLVIYLTVYLLVINRGLDVFVCARTILAIGALVFHLILLKKILGAELIQVIRRIVSVTLISGTATILGKSLAAILASGNIAQLLVGLCVAGIIALPLIYMTEKNNTLACIISAYKNRK